MALVVLFISFVHYASAQKINRKAVVERHKVVNKHLDTLSSLTVGNGAFAFTVDVTGLQTFPECYQKGIPLGTQSEWGWNSFTNTKGYRREEALRYYHLNGRDVPYLVQWNTDSSRQGAAANWFRQNPHRLQLGALGFQITKKDGALFTVADVQAIHQELNPWTGEILSRFSVEGVPVEVVTYAHQQQDLIAVRVRSPLLKEGRLSVRLRFPYPTGEWTDEGANFAHAEKHLSKVESRTSRSALIAHRLDSAHYFAALQWSGRGTVVARAPHDFLLSPEPQADTFSLTCLFTPEKVGGRLPDFTQTQISSIKGWSDYWNHGAAVDFSGSTNPRAYELERRIVLSQYLMKAQEAGHCPPQETGLTYNSWFGKPHLEMNYWHATHYALWGRPHLLEKNLGWYTKVAPKAKAIAQRQGFEGIRWQKMVSNGGDESPSSIGAFLVWQQPHYIYLAELCYRQQPTLATLKKYKDLLFATADFMASFPYYDKEKGRYLLGKGVIPAQERYKPEETFNPAYELVYWHWALQTAQQWRERLGLPRHKKWDEVIEKLSPLPARDGVYLAAESAPDSYTNPEYKTDHPSVLGAYGMLPLTSLLDTVTMRRTFNLIWDTWQWHDTWGWDFPMTAMTATRLHLPQKAMDALFMDVTTNTYLKNGHNYQTPRLRLYMPGNGGLLTAVAMMLAGYDGCTEENPGIPKDGTWKVKWEGFRKMP